MAIAAMASLAAPSAGAQAPDLGSYGAGGSATALVLNLLGQELAVSDTTAAVSSKPEAAADGAALLIAGNPVPGAAPAKAPGGEATNEACAIDVDLGEQSGGALSALDVGVACVNTSASVEGGMPKAQSESGEVVINITSPAGTALQPILDPLFDGVEQVTGPLLDALEPILGGIEEPTGIEARTIVDDLLQNLQDQAYVLAQIVVAPTVSQASASEADGVVGRAGANGVTIHLLPGIAQTLADLGLDIAPSQTPILTVRLGQAVAEVVRDPVTGEATTDGSAAQLLSIEANDQLGILQDITGQLSDAINGLAIDQLGCTGDNPLADVLCIDLGAVRELTAAELTARGLDFGEGTVGIGASAANIQILPIAADALGGPAIGLRLAAADAAAGAAAPLPAAPVETPVTTSLPRTGADSLLPAALALFAAAAGGLFLVRRSRIV